ncbi:MAG: hypothetical protein JSV74_05040 [Dehalococcoidia bacterium]|nr:MAG: hypothetical protein JSV74_05040 [Dehalococcoidia bacterium]
MSFSESEDIEANPIFNAIFVRISENINNIFPDYNNRRFYKSLLAGGKAMANAVIVRCQEVKRICGEIDEVKASALTRLFTLLMLSQAFRWLDQASEGGEVAQVNLSAVSAVLNLFDDNCQESVEDFMNLDTQFKYELKHHDHLTHLAVFLLAKACEACGHKCIEWSRASLPIKSLEILTHSRAIVDATTINSVNDIRAMLDCHAIGIQAMVNYHEEHTKT